MKTVCLVVAVALLAVSLACITQTVVEVIRKSFGMWTLRFWGAVAFHVVTAVVGAILLAAARRKDTPAAEGGTQP